MDRQMQLYWKAFEELVSTNDILKSDFNPIYYFEDQLVEGAIVDLGCGQKSPLIKYAGTERRLIGIDEEKSQLVNLRSRMAEIAGADKKEWELIINNLKENPLPQGPYAMAIMCNILHFFSLKECAAIIAKLNEQLVAGSLISVCVHSNKHPANDPNNADSMAYFKHFFTQEDLDYLFPPNQFERLYRADVERNYEKTDGKVAALWAEWVVEDFNITSNKEKAHIWQQATSQQSTAEIIAIYRKR